MPRRPRLWWMKFQMARRSWVGCGRMKARQNCGGVVEHEASWSILQREGCRVQGGSQKGRERGGQEAANWIFKFLPIPAHLQGSQAQHCVAEGYVRRSHRSAGSDTAVKADPRRDEPCQHKGEAKDLEEDVEPGWDEEG
jgi:hypothetical protein